nr:MAG TPA: hypothetical protein [Caudoviricetes sp.]
MAETKTLQEILLTLGEKPLNVNVNLPGIKGENGQDGRNGADGLSAYDIAQLNGFTGTQQEWLDSLKAGAVADEARTMLLNGNVWCKSNSIADVLAAVISNLGKAFPRTEFKPLTVGTVLKGQRVIAVEGEPHYFVKVAGMETQFEIGDNGTGSISIEPLGVDDVHLTYHNFIGEKVGTATVQGVTTGEQAPDDTFEENGVTFKLYGRKVVINATAYTGNDNSGYYQGEPKFNFFGKWNKSDIDTIEIYANKPRVLFLNTSTLALKADDLKGKVILVRDPKNISFKTGNGWESNQAFVIGTLEHGTYQVDIRGMNAITWDEATHRYKNTGYFAEHL